jgi:transcriptional regulator with XRE-family HTH domain
MKLNVISKELGFSASQWSNYEQGISFPKFLDLIKIAKYFGVSETDLIHNDLQRNFISSNMENSKNLEIGEFIETIKNQNKLIKIQENEIKELAIKIQTYKNTSQ